MSEFSELKNVYNVDAIASDMTLDELSAEIEMDKLRMAFLKTKIASLEQDKTRLEALADKKLMMKIIRRSKGPRQRHRQRRKTRKAGKTCGLLNLMQIPTFIL